MDKGVTCSAAARWLSSAGGLEPLAVACAWLKQIARSSKEGFTESECVLLTKKSGLDEVARMVKKIPMCFWIDPMQKEKFKKLCAEHGLVMQHRAARAIEAAIREIERTVVDEDERAA